MRFAYVIGSPITHSISPAMHNAAFSATAIDARYEAAEVPPAGLASWVAGARTADTLGFNVTLPHKETIILWLDRVEGDAQLTRAVNCVEVQRDGAASGKILLVGANTDATGFRRALAEDAAASLTGQRVLLLGAGGAARAVALVALQDQAAELWVANRHGDRARQLLEEFAPLARGTWTQWIELSDERTRSLLAAASVIVNATSVGMRSNDLPIDPTAIQPGALVVDLIYNPRETAFLKAAQVRGARVLGGLGMLVHQAAAAFARWTGVEAPIRVMREAADTALRQARV